MADLEWTPAPLAQPEDASNQPDMEHVPNAADADAVGSDTTQEGYTEGEVVFKAPTPFGLPPRQPDYNLPTTFLYGEGHVWAQIDDLRATLGLTEFLFDLIYRQYFFLQLPKPGSLIKRGRVIGAIDALKMAIPIVSPVSGTVLEVNDDVGENSQLPLLSPYSRGWLLKVELSQPIELRQLMRQQDYKQLLRGPHRLDFAKSV